MFQQINILLTDLKREDWRRLEAHLIVIWSQPLRPTLCIKLLAARSPPIKTQSNSGVISWLRSHNRNSVK